MGASERDEFLRAAWRATTVVGTTEANRRFVFVDECSTNTSLRPLDAWARRGRACSLLGTAQLGTESVTLLASRVTLSGMGPSLAVEGATTRAVFEVYVGEVLAPSLRPGQQVVVVVVVVVMDNLWAHKGGRVRELIERRGWEVVYLPP